MSRNVSMEAAVSFFTVEVISSHDSTACDLNCQSYEDLEYYISCVVCVCVCVCVLKPKIQRLLQYFGCETGRRAALFISTLFYNLVVAFAESTYSHLSSDSAWLSDFIHKW